MQQARNTSIGTCSLSQQHSLQCTPHPDHASNGGSTTLSGQKPRGTFMMPQLHPPTHLSLVSLPQNSPQIWASDQPHPTYPRPSSLSWATATAHTRPHYGGFPTTAREVS